MKKLFKNGFGKGGFTVPYFIAKLMALAAIVAIVASVVEKGKGSQGLFVQSAQGQVAATGFATVTKLLDSGTNKVSLGTTNTTKFGLNGANTLITPVAKIPITGKELALSFEFRATEAGAITNSITFDFRKALTDGVGTNNAAATDPILFTVPANGTTLVRMVTNVTVGAIGDYYLYGIRNTNSAASLCHFTNIVVKYRSLKTFSA